MLRQKNIFHSLTKVVDEIVNIPLFKTSCTKMKIKMRYTHVLCSPLVKIVLFLFYVNAFQCNIIQLVAPIKMHISH